MTTPPPALFAVILAAGGSRRMGSPKALLSWRGQPWIRHHVDALAPQVDQVIAVLGARAEDICPVLPPAVAVVENPDWQRTGMADSLALALVGLPDRARVVVTPVDLPPPPARVLRALLGEPGPVVPTAGGLDAHPVLILAGAARAALPGATLRELLATAPRLELGWQDGLRNLNTPADWTAWCAEQADTAGGA